MKTCKNCNKENCNRLRRELCDECYYIYRYSSDFKRVCDIPDKLTDQQISLINGHMLGDGSIEKIGNSSLSIMRQATDAAYLEFSVKILHNLFASDPLPLKVKDKFDKRTQKIYQYVSCGTKCLTILNQFRSLWYDKDGIKVVPRDLALDPLSIAVWFCDDGDIQVLGNCQIVLHFATDGFSHNDVMFLIDLLEKRYDTRFRLSIRKREGKEDQHTITASTYSAIKVLIDIEKVFPDGMERKRIWTEDLLVRCENSPKVYSYTLSSMDRKEKVLNYIKSVDEFTLVKMGQDLGWTFTRKNGKVEVPTSNIYKYIKPFVDAGYLVEINRKDCGYVNGNKYVFTELGKMKFDE